MKKFICILLLSIQPALAVNNATGTGSTPIIIFPNHASRTLQVVYAPASSITDANTDVYDFTPINGDMQINDYLNANGTYTLSPPPPPAQPVLPNTTGFVTAIKTDPTFTPEIRIGLGTLIGLLASDVEVPAAMSQDWADAIATYGSTWLTPAVQTTVLGYATTYDIPLVMTESVKKELLKKRVEVVQEQIKKQKTIAPKK